MSEKGKEKVEVRNKDWGYFMRNIVPFIGIGATIIGMVVGLVILWRVGTLKPDEILMPVVTFDAEADGDKQAPRKSGKGALDVVPRGDIGFSAHWVKEKGYFDIEWELNRKNYEARMRYFLYIELKADKKEPVSIALMDKNKVYTSTDTFEVSDQLTVKLIPFLSFNTYWKDDPAGSRKTAEIEEFEWESVTYVHLGPEHNEASDNTIYCEKMYFLFAE